ncbi:hypothetical protein WCP94_000641 (plasmid) [Bilophila wadsworthia]
MRFQPGRVPASCQWEFFRRNQRRMQGRSADTLAKYVFYAL